MGKDKVKVGVRVRPFSAREKALLASGNSTESAVIIQVIPSSNQLILTHPNANLNNSNSSNNSVSGTGTGSSGGTTSSSSNNNSSSSSSNSNNSHSQQNNGNNRKPFTFDHVFDQNASQEEIFEGIGTDLLTSAFEGYNACLFAYGQTGSGKSYTMLGSLEQRGVIPRLCNSIFKRISEETSNNNENVIQPPPSSSGLEGSSSSSELPNVFKVEVSYMEIYNEKVRDLLTPKKTTLKVREHSLLGPYVEELSLLAVKSAEDVATLMQEGNKSRTVAATNMNSESSRSHAVFTIVLTQTMTDSGSGVTGEKVSKISLVDLAGSERAVKTGAVGERLKEGSNINKSLTTLGLVISKLAEGSASNNSKDSKSFIPYRDSVLTWLLKDNLGGNSRTIMISTVSPSPDNYEETLSTLRYADRAKRIVNNAVVNEDPNAKLIRELQAEVKQLRELLKSHVTDKGLNEQLNQSEKLMRQVSETWEEKVKRSEQAQHERQAALEKMGISVQQSGISVQNDRFYLVNLNADPALNELLVYYLKDDRTVVGRPDAPGPPDIQLTGLGIENLHCELIIEPDQTLYLIPYPKAHTCVNGERLERRRVLHHGDRILWGNHHFMRLNSPIKNHPNASSSSTASSTSSSSTSSSTSSFNMSSSVLQGGGSSNGNGESSSSSYEQASAEFSMKQLITSDPIHEAVAKLESKHQKDKAVALEKQRQELERQFNALMHVLSPSSPLPPQLPWDAQSFLQQHHQLQQQSNTNSVQIVANRNTKMSEGLKLLKEYLVKANQMVREATEIANIMKVDVRYSVTLLIPPNNLTPNRQKGALITEPSIQVDREGHYPQIWSMEKLQNRLVDMREIYEENGACALDQANPFNKDPPAAFFEIEQPHVLLGIANVFLQVLFYDDVTLSYPVPVINQQGEIVGRLHVEVAKMSGRLETSSPGRKGMQHSTKLDNSLYEEYEDEEDDDEEEEPKTITVKVTVRHLAGVTSSHYVFCQYVFCDKIELVPPSSTTTVVRFDHTRYFTIPVSEEFIDYCSESALSIEVWGHRGNSMINNNGLANGDANSNNCSTNHQSNTETNNNSALASVTDRWKEVTSQMKLWVEIQEMNENGEYFPVEVEFNDAASGGGGVTSNCGTGGVYQLRQGLQRRILIRVETSATVGQLPIVCDEIDQVSLGAITVRSTTRQRNLDSYQEEDLNLLRQRWGEALKRRREYLDSHLQELAKKPEKTNDDLLREKSLVAQWLMLTEERNAVLVPAPGSSVPGAPTNSTFKPELGMEEHMPIMFLDISDDVLSTESSPHSPPMVTGQTAGLNSQLPKEHDAHFVALPMIRKSYGDFYSAWSDQRMSTESWALVSWDSSVHDSTNLNKPTPPGEVIYVILRVALRLSHPVQMDCILRKRICLLVKKNRASITERLRARFTMRKSDELDSDSRTRRQTGVTYQIVSHLPKSSEQLETRESLATLAVSHGESYIEEYLRSISAVDSILNLDRMRQSVHLREEQMKNRPRNNSNRSYGQANGGGMTGGNGTLGGFMRKTLSVPNISQLFVGGTSTSSGNLAGNNGNAIKFTAQNGNISGLLNNSTPPGLPDNLSIGGHGALRRHKPYNIIRSESLANLSGFTSPTGGFSPSQQQSPQQSRPSSLNLGYTNPGTGIISNNSNNTPHASKWTTVMTTVMEEESSGYASGSQKSSEDYSPTTTTG